LVAYLVSGPYDIHETLILK